MPKSDAVTLPTAISGGSVDQKFVDVVVDRWRGATLNTRARDAAFEGSATTEPAPMPERRLDPDRYRLLKKTSFDNHAVEARPVSLRPARSGSICQL